MTGNGAERHVVIAWDEPTNNHAKKGTTYNLYLKDKTTNKWLYNPMAVVGGEKDGWRKVNRMGNVFLNKQIELHLLSGEYEWKVQAVDPARFGGSFAPLQSILVTTGISTVELFNPNVSIVKNSLRIENKTDEVLDVKIYSTLGQKLIGEKFTSTYQKTLTAGIYIIEITGKNKQYQSKIIIP
ncbi:MAG: T9SS type A sorting domain-containing protein [Paludibacteraceae bacterium]